MQRKRMSGRAGGIFPSLVRLAAIAAVAVLPARAQPASSAAQPVPPSLAKCRDLPGPEVSQCVREVLNQLQAQRQPASQPGAAPQAPAAERAPSPIESTRAVSAPMPIAGPPARVFGLNPGRPGMPDGDIAAGRTRLNWRDVPGALRYQVQFSSPTGGALPALVQTDRPGAQVQLPPGHTYAWTVTACNAAGCSPPSQAHLVRTRAVEQARLEPTASPVAPVSPPMAAPQSRLASGSINQIDNRSSSVAIRLPYRFPVFDQTNFNDENLYSKEDREWAKGNYSATCLSTIYAIIQNARGDKNYRIGPHNFCSGGSAPVGGISAGSDRAISNSSYETVRSELSKGNPVILQTELFIQIGGKMYGHYVLVTGVDGEGLLETIDPWRGGVPKISPADWMLRSAVSGTPRKIRSFRLVDFSYRGPPQTCDGAAPTQPRLAAPTRLSPGSASSSFPSQSGSSVTLSWRGVGGAALYDVGVREILPTGQPAPSLHFDDKVSGTSVTVQKLLPGRTYRWNVASCSADGLCGPVSQTLYFAAQPAAIAGNAPPQVAPPRQPVPPTANVPPPAMPPSVQQRVPAMPTGLTPGTMRAPGPLLPSNIVQWRWSPVAGAEEYDFEVTDASTGRKVINRRARDPVWSARLDPSKSYRWTVRACNGAGCSNATERMHIMTPRDPAAQAASPPSVPPATPAGLSPGSASSPGGRLSSTSLQFRWQAVPGADDYEITVTDMESRRQVREERAREPVWSGRLDPDKPYRWAVRACNRAGCSSNSERAYFRTPQDTRSIGTPPPPPPPPPSGQPSRRPAMPTGLSPGAMNAPGPRVPSTIVQLRWSAVPGAEEYDLEVRNAATGRKIVDRRTRDPVWSGRLEAGERYRWIVRACNDTGCSSTTERMHFSTP